MATSTDLVGTGFVESLAHPGGNITGLNSFSPELGGKRLQVLREAVPGLSRLACLWNPDVRGAVLDYKETDAAARALLQSVEVSSAEDLDRAFSATMRERA
jgi:putative ABC transport system substrate-binding protein